MGFPLTRLGNKTTKKKKNWGETQIQSTLFFLKKKVVSKVLKTIRVQIKNFFISLVKDS